MNERTHPVDGGSEGTRHRRTGWPGVVALRMLTRPMLVLGLVTGIGVLVGLEVLDSTWSLPGGDGAMLLAGAAFLGGLRWAPLFTTPPPGRAVRPDVEPELTTLVARVARATGIRVPVAVRVVPTVDAALGTVPAHSGGGLVLLLGWPLLRRLTQRQLAAVMAHEFGHEVHGGDRRDRAVLSARADLLESLAEGAHIPRWWARRVLAGTREQAWELETAADRTSVEVAGVGAARSALLETHRAGIAFDLVIDALLADLEEADDADVPDWTGTPLRGVYDALDAMLSDAQGRARVDEAVAAAEAIERSAPDLLSHPPFATRLETVTAVSGGRAEHVGGLGSTADLPVPVHEAAAIEAWCAEELFDLDPGSTRGTERRASRVAGERVVPGPTAWGPATRGPAARLAVLGVCVVLVALAGVTAFLGWRLSRETGRDVAATEDLEGGLGVTVLCALALLLAWAWRGLRHTVAARRAPSPGIAQVFWSVPPALVPLAAQCWLELGSGRWQRVMWHPVVEGVRGRVPVVVHGSEVGRRAVVISIDGVRLVPVGRLRRRRPGQMFVPWDDARLCREHVVVPSDAVGAVRSPSLRARTPVVLAVVGVAAGTLLGVSVGPGALVPLALAVPAVLINGWALSGPVP